MPIATPTAMVAALSSAARLGILIKNVGDIELATRINAFIFDKTGTLTTGKLAVSRLAPIEGITPAELLYVSASAEKYSNHPTAKALQDISTEAGVELAEPKDFSETAGRGIRTKVDSRDILVGRAQWLIDNGIKEDISKSVDLNETEGFSLIHVARDGKYLGWIGLRDEIREEAKESLASLMQSGVRRIAMVTGDRQPVAARVARESVHRVLQVAALAAHERLGEWRADRAALRSVGDSRRVEPFGIDRVDDDAGDGGAAGDGLQRLGI